MSTTLSARAVSSVTRTTMREPSIWSTMPARLARDRGTAVARDHALHAGADERGRRLQQRHRLALHVRAHQRPVGVVVLEERDQRRRHRDQLLGRDVDHSDRVRPRQHELAVLAAADQLAREAAVGVQLGVGLGDGVAPLLHGREVDHLVGHLAVDHAAVGALDEAVLVDPGVGREAVDQADVRAFGGLDRADPAVMGRVHVAHLEARPLAGQAARAQRREAALVGDLRERVGLVHELRQLRAAEELAHRRRHRLGVDQVVRHRRVDLDRAHALAHRALHAQQADAELVLHQLADRAHAPVAEMIDVVDLAAAVLDLDQHLDDGDDVLVAQHAQRVLALQARGACSSSPGRPARGRSARNRRSGCRTAPRRCPASAARPGAAPGRCRAAPPRGSGSGRAPACCGCRGRPSDGRCRAPGSRRRRPRPACACASPVSSSPASAMDQAGLLVDQVAAQVAADQLLGRVVDLAACPAPRSS